MNPIAVIIETAANALRAVRNLLAAILPAPEFVVLRVSGGLPERRPPRAGLLQRLLPGPLAMPAQESLEEWRERLRLLAADPRVKGVVIEPADLRAGPASLESLRAALAAFRDSGKRLVAYVPVSDLPTYYLASAADTVVVPESAELLLYGPRAEATFLRAVLDRLGILPQFHHIAEYKSAANRFLHAEMPAAQREMLTSILDSVFETMTAAIARSRAIAPSAVREAVDLGILSAADAARRALVDAVAFEDDLPALLGAGGRPARLVPWPQAKRRLAAPIRWRSLQPRAIGVVQLVGTIVPGESRDFPVPLPLFGQHLAGHESVVRAFRTAETMPQVKAVVFHVESPGGSAVASDMIWREVARVQQTKPVVVYMGNVAGSGGYYVACGSRHIVASATTLTGSIGVVSGKFDASGAYQKGGLRREVLARGATATMPSAFAPYSQEEWRALVTWMEDVYARFKAHVAAGRRLTGDAVELIARGRVWTGAEALERGLVDEIGDFDTAVRKARSLAGIAPGAEVPVLTIRPPKAAAIPAATPAAWGGAFHAAAALWREPALLLMPSDTLSWTP